jgi:flagellar motor switch protein FliN/FliY
VADDETQTPEDEVTSEEDAMPNGDAPSDDDAVTNEADAEDAASDDAADEAASEEIVAEDATPDAAAPDEETPEELVAEEAESSDVVAEEADAPAEDAPTEDAPAAATSAQPSSGEAVSRDDIDQLFAEQGDAPEAPAPAQPAGGGMTEVDAAAASLLGENAAVLAPFGGRARETLSLGVESAMSQSVTVANTSVAATEYGEIEKEFSATPHLGFELRLALTETESHLLAALIPLPDAGALFSLETTPDQMADETFAQTQVDAAAGPLRELLDLVSLTLFTESLSAAEVTLSDQRVDQIEFTMGMVADVAQGATPFRIDIVLALPGGIPVTLTLVVPSTLVARIAETIAEAADASVGAAEPANAGGAPPADTHTPITGALGAAAPAEAEPDEPRPATTIGASPDVEVHPVRFPPLPDIQPIAQGHRGLDLIMDVQMRVAVELGRSTMTVEDVLSLGPGSVVELNKLAGEAVDILVNERLIARGEVVVVDENFGARVTEIVSPRRRASVMSA